MQTLSEIRALLYERGLHPKHRLGQIFLHDKNILIKLIEAADLQDGELVLEVGPGTGTLTEALVDAGAEILTCEIDSDIASIIEDRLSSRVRLIRGDCLDSHRRLSCEISSALGDRPFKLVANLPYQIASPLICTMLIDQPSCAGQYVTIQREVADRLLANTCTKEYGPLTIIVAALADVKRICTIKPSSFWPQPKVESAMVSILPAPSERGPGGEGSSALDTTQQRRDFARFVTQLFTKRRKQLGTILGRDCEWPTGVTADLRPEALPVERIVTLWQRFGTMC